MSLFKFFIAFSFLTSQAFSDEVSKNACGEFLPAFGDANIALINNGLKRDYGDPNDERAKRFFGVMKVVDEHVSKKTQERCEKGEYPIMDLNDCYTTCKEEVSKSIKGNYAWSVQGRAIDTNACYGSCTGAYVAQDAITKTLRKVALANTQCAPVNILDSQKAKQIDDVLKNVPTSNEPKQIER